jgi:ABC-type dipeptide/oligopeptide/nickel transport system ATPase subunit
MAPRGQFTLLAPIIMLFGLLFFGDPLIVRSALAQPPATPVTDDDVAEDARRSVIETMTVTAQKQEENVQSVPMSVTLLNQTDIDDLKIDSIRDLADIVPNLMVFQHGASAFNTPSMRGISASLEFLQVSTGLFVDGVPVLASTGFEQEMLDIERIEVLRGPQGTLYGKGTEAGAINIITRQPDNTFRGRVTAEAGKLASVEAGDGYTGALSMNLSGPVHKDALYFGVAAKYYSRDGFIENTTTGDTATAQCHDFINELPAGCDTMVGEEGATLSGGERQRISIAGAILKNAPIILLDEATASVDPENEALIQRAINVLVASKTLVIIAHRLSTITAADQIVVLNDCGELEEVGDHDTLLANNGRYARLWQSRLQAKRWRISQSTEDALQN